MKTQRNNCSYKKNVFFENRLTFFTPHASRYWLFLERMYYDDVFLFIFTVLLFVFLLLVFVPPLILFVQYYNVEKNRIIEFDPIERKLLIETNYGKSKLEIDNSTIKSVEYFNGGLAKEPYDYEYLRITLNDNSKLILTNMTTELSYYEPLFKAVKREYNKRKMYNKIKTHTPPAQPVPDKTK